jgi:hypothetical protein
MVSKTNIKISKNTLLLQEIIGLAQTISDDRDNPTHVFASYSGHCSTVHVYGYLNGYGSTDEWDFNFNTYTNNKDCIKDLTKIKKYLMALLPSKAVAV